VADPCHAGASIYQRHHALRGALTPRITCCFEAGIWEGYIFERLQIGCSLGNTLIFSDHTSKSEYPQNLKLAAALANVYSTSQHFVQKGT